MSVPALLCMCMALVTIVLYMPHADGRYDSPSAQIAAGVPVGEIGCNDEKVLAMRSADSPVCVSVRTAERMMWEIVSKEPPPATDESDLNHISNMASPDEPLIKLIKSEPPFPRTGTVHFKDLPRINHTGDMLRLAYTEAEANITAYRIADALGRTIGPAIAFDGKLEKAMYMDSSSYTYTLANDDGSQAGHIKIGRVFSSESMNGGYFHDGYSLYVSIFDIVPRTHEERIQFVLDLHHKMGYEAKRKFTPSVLDFHRQTIPNAITIISDYLIVRHTPFEKFEISEGSLFYVKMADGSSVVLRYDQSAGGGEILRIQFNSIFSDETLQILKEPFPITREDAKRIIYDFASTSPILTDKYHGCQIKFNDYDEISVAGPYLIAGVPLYSIRGDVLGECQYVRWSNTDNMRTDGNYDDQQPPSIYTDAWTGQFINIGSRHGYCLWHGEDECVITLDGDSGYIIPRYKVKDCWCPGSSEYHLMTYSCYSTPVYNYDDLYCNWAELGYDKPT